jgi:hypothetical protein
VERALIEISIDLMLESIPQEVVKGVPPLATK